MRGIRQKHAEYSCDLRAANHPRSRFHPVENVVNVSLAYPPSWKATRKVLSILVYQGATRVTVMSEGGIRRGGGGGWLSCNEGTGLGACTALEVRNMTTHRTHLVLLSLFTRYLAFESGRLIGSTREQFQRSFALVYL